MSLAHWPASLYGAAFPLAVATAPHRHIHPIADLLSRDPSDSALLRASQHPEEEI